MTGKTVRRALAIAICLIAGISAGAQEVTTLDTVVVRDQKAPTIWMRAESQHFVVYSETDSDEVSLLLNNLERLDYMLRIYLRDYLRPSDVAQKLTFYYHRRQGGFDDITISQPPEAVGLYSSCPTAVQGFGVQIEPIPELKSEQLAFRPLSESQSYIFEAYARHFIYRYTDIRSPSSFIEGMAQYFSGLRFSDTQFVLGRTPATLGSYLNFLDDGHRFNLEYRDVLEHPDWQATGYVGTGYAGIEGVTLEYRAKSWVLMHYMLSSEGLRKQMAQYLNLVHADTPAVAAFEQAFGMKVDDLDTAMWRYRRRDAHVLRVDFPTPTDIPISFRTLSHAEGDVVPASAQLKSCPDRKTGEALLSKLSRQSDTDTNNEFVLLTLSRAQIDWGNPNDAVSPLTALLRAQPEHAEALQLLGLAHLRLADKQRGPAKAAQLDAARRYLTQARTLNPGSSEAAYALFKVELGTSTKPSQLALSSAIAAWKNAPEVPKLARTAALAYAYAGQADETETVLTSLSQNSEDAKSAAWARQWHKRLAGGVNRAELVAELRLDAATPSFKEWTVAANDTLRIIECNAGLDQARRAMEAIPGVAQPSMDMKQAMAMKQSMEMKQASPNQLPLRCMR
jgi:tetratricopeptide (TPR) repeat protein